MIARFSPNVKWRKNVHGQSVYIFCKRPGKRLLGELDFSRKAIKETVLVLLFTSAKSKQKRTFSCYFLRRAKSNQKHAEGCGPLDSGERFKALYWHAFYRNLIGSCLKQLSCFEPVRGGYFTAQGVASVFEKACSDLGGQ